MKRLILAGMAAVLVGACVPAPYVPGNTYYVREGMVNHINPPTEAIWNMQVELMDDYGNFDPDLMTPEHWANLYSAANQLALEAERMAGAEVFVAANPSGILTDPPEGTDLVAIQERLTQNGAAYRAYSQSLERQSASLVDAVNARDTERLTELVNNMQPVCKACHDVFWYPEEYQ